jgi:hypothetical protein
MYTHFLCVAAYVPSVTETREGKFDIYSSLPSFDIEWLYS